MFAKGCPSTFAQGVFDCAISKGKWDLEAQVPNAGHLLTSSMTLTGAPIKKDKLHEGGAICVT